MTYKIEFTPSALRQFEKLENPIQKRLSKKIDFLSKNPRPSGVEKLSAEDDLYRIRAGDYRVIYQIQDKVLLVLVVKVGHRREVYQKK